MEELEGRQMALAHLNRTGGRQEYKNFHRNQIRGIKGELARRWRAQAAEKRRTRNRRAVQRRVRQAANAFIAPLYKPRTATSPAGMRAAAAVGRHTPAMSYVNVQAAMRQMLRARKRRRSPK